MGGRRGNILGSMHVWDNYRSWVGGFVLGMFCVVGDGYFGVGGLCGVDVDWG